MGILAGWVQTCTGGEDPYPSPQIIVLSFPSQQLLDRCTMPWPGVGKLSQNPPFSWIHLLQPTADRCPSSFLQHLCAKTCEVPRLRVGRPHPPLSHPLDTTGAISLGGQATTLTLPKILWSLYAQHQLSPCSPLGPHRDEGYQSRRVGTGVGRSGRAWMPRSRGTGSQEPCGKIGWGRTV